MKIAIVTDSSANFTQEEKNEHLIASVPVNVMYKGKVYRDGVDLTASQAYQFLEENPEDWATSAPSPGDFLTAFKELISQGAEAIICLTLAQKISATWNSARMAKEMLKKEMPEIEIEVIDSNTGAIGEKLMALRISRAAKEGKSFKELIMLAEELKEKIRVFLLLETIKYIYRSGRIPEIASKIGSILPLKPILGLHQGKVHFQGATVSKEKSKEKILKILKEKFDLDFPEIGLMHINSLEEAEKFKEEISRLAPQAKISINEFSPIVGYVTGRETIGIGFFVKK